MSLTKYYQLMDLSVTDDFRMGELSISNTWVYHTLTCHNSNDVFWPIEEQQPFQFNCFQNNLSGKIIINWRNADRKFCEFIVTK